MQAMGSFRSCAMRRLLALTALALAVHVRAAEKTDDASSRESPAEVRRQITERVPDAAASISVECSGGRVVLGGTVEHLSQRWLAQEAAENVRGVQEVVNRIHVAGTGVENGRIQRAVREALKADPATLALEIDVGVQDGVVTLSGAVDTVPQKRIAEWVTSDRIGVREVVTGYEWRRNGGRTGKSTPNCSRTFAPIRCSTTTTSKSGCGTARWPLPAAWTPHGRKTGRGRTHGFAESGR
jgi:osmotically-inducible protein OsmY